MSTLTSFSAPVLYRVVTDLLRSTAVAVIDYEVEELVLMKLVHRAGKNPVNAAIGLPPPQCPKDARVVDFRTIFVILFDRQRLPLTAHAQQLKGVVEDLVQPQRRCATAPTRAQMRQDKLLELLN